MSLISFVQDTHTFEEVFEYLNKYVDEYALKQLYNGSDISGIKNVKEILQSGQRKLVAEFTQKKEKKVTSRAL